MDSRAQRYRDRLRAEGRSVAIRTARRTRDILDGYVSTRRGTKVSAPKMRVLWGRLIAVTVGLTAGAYCLAHLWR